MSGSAIPTSLTCLESTHENAAANPELRRSPLAPFLLWLYRVLNCRRRWRVARVLIALAMRLEGGAMRSATARNFLATYHGVAIGAYSYGECFDPALVPPGVSIGRYVSMARGVRLFTQNHPLDRLSTHPFFYEATPGVATSGDLPPGCLVIGHDVWMGCNVIVTPGCHRIGHGAVIGAGAVVTKDVPDFAIVAGAPARKVRDRFPPEVAARLATSNWWHLSQSEVLARRSELDQLLSPQNTPNHGTPEETHHAR